MNKTIIEDRNTKIDKTLQETVAHRSNKIDDNKECKKDILADRFLKWSSMNPKMIKDEFNIKEALLRLEKNSLITPYYPIETHRKSLLGKGIVWFKRTILKVMLRFDVSLQHQNQFNLTLVEVIRRLVERADSVENELRMQKSLINDLKKKLEEQTCA